MRKILAIIGALITGGIGVAISILPQAADAAMSKN
jgi:preprotein translocase subunit Sss1